MTTTKTRRSTQQKRAKCADVQAGTPVQVGGNSELKSLITMVRGQNVQALTIDLQQARQKCPSGSQFLKDLDTDIRVDFIWLPIDRVAMLLAKNLKTIRRMVASRKLMALKHQIPTKNGATIKTFILATEEIIQAEYDLYRDKLRRPDLNFEEEIKLGELSYPSVFLVYYDDGSVNDDSGNTNGIRIDIGIDVDDDAEYDPHANTAADRTVDGNGNDDIHNSSKTKNAIKSASGNTKLTGKSNQKHQTKKTDTKTNNKTKASKRTAGGRHVSTR
jgi:hypothetical protein